MGDQCNGRYANATHSSYKDSPDEDLKRLVKAEYQKKSRDNARTPMQWDDTPQAGFTTSDKPWMRVNDNYKEVNAASQTDRRRSVYHTYRLILEKRKQYTDIFVYGSFELIDEPNEKIFAYKRRATSGETALIVCNFSLDAVKWKMDDEPKEVLFTTSDRELDQVSGGELSLAPCEAIALLL
jgi:glycosidase